MKPMLKAPGTKRLKLKHDSLLSNFALNYDMRCYNQVATLALLRAVEAPPNKVGRCGFNR
jgi:hypothetical protein